MADDNNLEICYNRGCGKKFDPNNNNKEDCQHHPGHPVFHDAYKGWSCCNKKCTDFTEFLSIKGCTKSKHSNIKPPELPKPVVDKSKANEVIEVSVKPLNSTPALERPPFESPQVTLKPTVSPALLEQIQGLTVLDSTKKDVNSIAIGQSCKNNSCKRTYQGPASNDEVCTYHPGVPIFHEGLKYWSCCQKKTTDFAVFLEQPGCSQGNHVWVQKGASNKKVKCRMDWHQTGTHVIVSVYAKKYNPDSSFIKLNPVHLTVDLYFPEENSRYNLDIELRGIVDVDASSATMLPTKTEIKLRKKEPGSWSKLDIPRQITTEEPEETAEDNITSQVDAVDLSDI
ncbi:cysteine and histidine-rich domain (CHORD)-containing 1 [Nasonia vitripennis]|uniref:Cysteine and histidine-rich domain-containing protein n=1 Tax=Nasonia vitripennis TaxID=7425 RepID=A0A7M6UVB2_NASVI|nr:cysteine and histidine-rich domain (CHORD)-containing 1 [Nasonia vitripennis]